MRIPVEWLKEFVELSLKPKALAEKLTMSGVEVEKIEGEGAGLVLELQVTPNRADCLSIQGVAREVSAITGARLKNFGAKPPKGSGSMKDFVKIEIKDSKRCPRYTARIVRDVKIGPSPEWMVSRLARAGIRSINNVVDSTNYVMVESGQPLHAFDLKRILDSKISVKKASEGATFVTLDGVERRLSSDDLLIADSSGPVALAGVMGGANSEVGPGTTDLFLESAAFEPAGVRRTSKRLGLASESSKRFERGVDPNNTLSALQRVTELIVQTAGGIPTADWADIYTLKCLPKKIRLSLDEIERILGIKVSASQSMDIMKALGFSATKVGSRFLSVIVPTSRPDIERPIDLIEEITRIMGYDKIAETMPLVKMCRIQKPKFEREICEARTELVNAGFSEAVLYGFTSSENLSRFHVLKETVIPVSNPIALDQAVMLVMLLPGLMDVAKTNLNRQIKDLRLFAVQSVYETEAGRPTEVRHVACLICGRRNSASWERSKDQVDFYDAKGALEILLSSFGCMTSLKYEKSSQKFMHPGASADVYLDGKCVGVVGELHPDVMKAWDIETPFFVFEINLEEVFEKAHATVVKFSEPSRFPFVERDLAMLVGRNIFARDIEAAVNASKSDIVQCFNIFDVYEGKGMPPDKKSVAVTIRYASPKRTLSDEEVRLAEANIVSELKMKLGAEQRT